MKSQGFQFPNERSRLFLSYSRLQVWGEYLGEDRVNVSFCVSESHTRQRRLTLGPYIKKINKGFAQEMGGVEPIVVRFPVSTLGCPLAPTS